MVEFCCPCSKRRKKRGLPLLGEKVSKDGKKIQASGKAGEMKSKAVDVKKSHEADSFKSMATLDVHNDATLPDQADSDDRLLL